MKYLLTSILLTTALPAFAHHGEDAGSLAAAVDHGSMAAAVLAVAAVGAIALYRLLRAS